jgi:hypothetical protein
MNEIKYLVKNNKQLDHLAVAHILYILYTIPYEGH